MLNKIETEQFEKAAMVITNSDKKSTSRSKPYEKGVPEVDLNVLPRWSPMRLYGLAAREDAKSMDGAMRGSAVQQVPQEVTGEDTKLDGVVHEVQQRQQQQIMPKSCDMISHLKEQLSQHEKEKQRLEAQLLQKHKEIEKLNKKLQCADGQQGDSQQQPGKMEIMSSKSDESKCGNDSVASMSETVHITPVVLDKLPPWAPMRYVQAS